MQKLTSKQRSYLKSLAQKIDPIFQIGKNGVTPELTEAIIEVLQARELIKISILQNCLEDPRQMCDVLSERSHSIPVQIIGRKMVLYKPSKNNPKIILPSEK